MAVVNPYLQVDGLLKRIGDRVLFDHISFGIAEGQRIGLIARNGTGKSTLLNIICGKDGYDEGNIVFRKDLKIGYLEQAPHYPDNLTVLEACFWHGNSTTNLIRAYEECMQTPGNPGLAELLERMDHEEAWAYEDKAKQILSKLKINDFNQNISTLSGGQLKRVALANVLITEPDLLILDDFSMGLDPGYRRLFVEYLKEYASAENKTVFLTSHIIQDMEMLIDDCMIMDYGRLLLHRPVKEIMDNFKRYRFVTPGNDFKLSADNDFWNPSVLGDKWEVYSFLNKEDVLSKLSAKGVKEITEENLSLEDAFIGLTGKY